MKHLAIYDRDIASVAYEWHRIRYLLASAIFSNQRLDVNLAPFLRARTHPKAIAECRGIELDLEIPNA